MENTQFSRMQKLAGIINEGMEPSKNKVSESDLREKIREMVMSALLEEAKKDAPEEDAPEEDVPAEDISGEGEFEDISMGDAGGKGEISVTQDAEAELSGTKGNVQDNLEAALKAAQDLGDEKLTNQIKNTLTFFTRSQVGQVTETQYYWQRLAGIIK